MQDKELYLQLLGLKQPCMVSEVAIDLERLKVDIWVEWPVDRRASCPKCGKLCDIYDHREDRQWRHLDTMQFLTILHCRIPRVNPENAFSRGKLTEKSFAATPCICHDGILEMHKIMQETFENCIMAYDKILLKSKDFEGDYAPAY